MHRSSPLYLALLLSALVGCSSTGGFSLWPPSFPLLKEAKQMASQTPVGMCLPRELSQQPLQDYFVEPGDRLLIEPVQLESELDLIGDQLVMVDGSIDLGEFGRLRVAGMTVEMIEGAVSDHLLMVSGESEQVNVRIVESNAALYYVLGEVGSPGAYELAGRELVLDGILKAGGITSQASPCNIVLVRPTGPCQPRVVLPVCYRKITQLGDTTTNYQLQPGDRIVVAPRTFCEEFAFWRQSKPCKCCRQPSCPEPQPCSIVYDNRFTRWLTPFPLPALDEQDNEPTTVPDSEESTLEPKTDSEYEPIKKPDPPKDTPADEEFFLPSIKKS